MASGCKVPTPRSKRQMPLMSFDLASAGLSSHSQLKIFLSRRWNGAAEKF
jgi:hypothetical protein